MKIAYIIPSLANKGPILVVRELVGQLIGKVEEIQIFYFDDIVEIDFPCQCTKISLHDVIKFDYFDIIHSHMLRPDYFIWKNKKFIKKARCVSTLHQDIVENMRHSHNYVVGKCTEFFWLRLFKKFDSVVALTEVMKQFYSKTIQGDKIKVIYNGRSLSGITKEVDSLDNDSINNLRSKYSIIGATAVLTKRKNIHLLVKALQLLPDFALIVVGDGKEMNNLISLARSINVFERCLFLGYRKDAFRFLPYFDVVAICSTSEGFPLSILEAGQYSKAVICSDIDLFKELFTEQEVVFLNLNNDQMMSDAILRAFSHKDELGSNLREKINSSYSAEIMSQKYLNLYRDILRS